MSLTPGELPLAVRFTAAKMTAASADSTRAMSSSARQAAAMLVLARQSMTHGSAWDRSHMSAALPLIGEQVAAAKRSGRRQSEQ